MCKIYLSWVRKTHTDSKEDARTCSKVAPAPSSLFKTSGMLKSMRTVVLASDLAVTSLITTIEVTAV